MASLLAFCRNVGISHFSFRRWLIPLLTVTLSLPNAHYGQASDGHKVQALCLIESIQRLVGLKPPEPKNVQDFRRDFKKITDNSMSLDSTIGPLFDSYRKRLSPSEFTDVAVLAIRKYYPSWNSGLVAVTTEALRASSHYDLTSAQVATIRGEVNRTVKGINWDIYDPEMERQQLLATNVPVGLKESNRDVPDDPHMSAHLDYRSRESFLSSQGRYFHDHLDGLARRKWGSRGGEMLQKLRDLTTRFPGRLTGDLSELIVDPGIVMRLDNFEHFTENYLRQPPHAGDPEKLSPMDLRNRFSTSLGSEITYRALALTPEQYESIKHSGIRSAFLRADKQNEVLNNDLLQPYFSKSLNPFTSSMLTLLSNRIRGGMAAWDPLISVTSYPEVAIAATKAYLQRNPASSTRIYLFKLKVPKLDIYSRSDAPDSLLPFGWKLSQKVSYEVKYKEKKSKTFDARDPGFESFLDLKISPSEIVESSAVEASQIPTKNDFNWYGKASFLLTPLSNVF
jgi:hypothetical protein